MESTITITGLENRMVVESPRGSRAKLVNIKKIRRPPVKATMKSIIATRLLSVPREIINSKLPKKYLLSFTFKWNIFIYGDGSHNEELERASDNDHLHGVHRVEHLDHTGVGCHHDPGDEG